MEIKANIDRFQNDLMEIKANIDRFQNDLMEIKDRFHLIKRIDQGKTGYAWACAPISVLEYMRYQFMKRSMEVFVTENKPWDSTTRSTPVVDILEISRESRRCSTIINSSRKQAMPRLSERRMKTALKQFRKGT